MRFLVISLVCIRIFGEWEKANSSFLGRAVSNDRHKSTNAFLERHVQDARNSIRPSFPNSQCSIMLCTAR
jgi:hypothetical protein